jgi:glycosyltransferase involved in cell wall biosynthesis
MIVVVPTNRPERAPAVYEQWRAQSYAGSELCFCPVRPFSCGDATVMPGTPTIGAARNIGLKYARERGHEWAVFWDDDNYHGPDYLAEIAREASPSVDVLSKGIAFVRHDSGLWLYQSPLMFFPGHSTSVRVSVAAQFPDLSLSEDEVWSHRMRERGARAKHLPPWGLVYDRRSPSGHAYAAAEAEFLRAHGPARGPFTGATNDQVDDPSPWTRRVLGPPVHARDEDIFAAMRARLGISP